MEGKGRLGRKAKAGFFDAYDDKGKRQGLLERHLREMYPAGGRAARTWIDVQHRLMFMAQALEAVRALEEGRL